MSVPPFSKVERAQSPVSDEEPENPAIEYCFGISRAFTFSR
jgi:hypothetical protein